MSLKSPRRAGPHALFAAIGVAAVAISVALGGCSSPAPVHTDGARVMHLTIASGFVHGTEPLTLVTSAGGGARRPLLVFLHGLHSQGYDNNSQLTNQMFAALHALGCRAPDIAFPYGDDSYWLNGPAAPGPPTCCTR
jgi:hypothetical protein